MGFDTHAIKAACWVSNTKCIIEASVAIYIRTQKVRLVTGRVRMSSAPTNERHEKRVVREYGSYGAIVGGALGLIVGVTVSGPHFSEWPASTLASVMLACACGGLIVGYIASKLASSSTAGDDNAGSALFDSSSDHSCAPSEGGGSGDSGGDGGGGD